MGTVRIFNSTTKREIINSYTERANKLEQLEAQLVNNLLALASNTNVQYVSPRRTYAQILEDTTSQIDRIYEEVQTAEDEGAKSLGGCREDLAELKDQLTKLLGGISTGCSKVDFNSDDFAARSLSRLMAIYDADQAALSRLVRAQENMLSPAEYSILGKHVLSLSPEEAAAFLNQVRTPRFEYVSGVSIEINEPKSPSLSYEKLKRIREAGEIWLRAGFRTAKPEELERRLLALGIITGAWDLSGRGNVEELKVSAESDSAGRPYYRLTGGKDLEVDITPTAADGENTALATVVAGAIGNENFGSPARAFWKSLAVSTAETIAGGAIKGVEVALPFTDALSAAIEQDRKNCFADETIRADVQQEIGDSFELNSVVVKRSPEDYYIFQAPSKTTDDIVSQINRDIASDPENGLGAKMIEDDRLHNGSYRAMFKSDEEYGSYVKRLNSLDGRMNRLTVEDVNEDPLFAFLVEKLSG